MRSKLYIVVPLVLIISGLLSKHTLDNKMNSEFHVPQNAILFFLDKDNDHTIILGESQLPNKLVTEALMTLNVNHSLSFSEYVHAINNSYSVAQRLAQASIFGYKSSLHVSQIKFNDFVNSYHYLAMLVYSGMLTKIGLLMLFGICCVRFSQLGKLFGIQTKRSSLSY